MTLARLLLTWLVLAVLMPVNGALREFGFKRVMPVRAADWLSVVSGSLVILFTTRALFRIPASEPSLRLAGQAALLVALTIAYEFALGVRAGRSLRDLLGHYAFWRGELWPVVLVVLAATPFLWRGR